MERNKERETIEKRNEPLVFSKTSPSFQQKLIQTPKALKFSYLYAFVLFVENPKCPRLKTHLNTHFQGQLRPLKISHQRDLFKPP
ncbi:hypothetical protein J0J30_22990, partial [Vibrio vulnificus]|nr:hypothetical protein [Vibrio vulnificus]